MNTTNITFNGTPLNNSHTEPITARQREVLLLAVSGMTNSQIAAQLGLSCRTVECHRLAIRKRLNLGNVADLTMYALQKGLITAQPNSTNLNR